jgi:hypothetical protein
LPLADLSHQIQLHGRVHFPFIGMTLVWFILHQPHIQSASG